MKRRTRATVEADGPMIEPPAGEAPARPGQDAGPSPARPDTQAPAPRPHRASHVRLPDTWAAGPKRRVGGRKRRPEHEAFYRHVEPAASHDVTPIATEEPAVAGPQAPHEAPEPFVEAFERAIESLRESGGPDEPSPGVATAPEPETPTATAPEPERESAYAPERESAHVPEPERESAYVPEPEPEPESGFFAPGDDDMPSEDEVGEPKRRVRRKRRRVARAAEVVRFVPPRYVFAAGRHWITA